MCAVLASEAFACTPPENIVTSCYPCNAKKRNRTPDQAGMTMLSQPMKPKWLPITVHLHFGGTIPEAWASYVYWNSAMVEDV